MSILAAFVALAIIFLLFPHPRPWLLPDSTAVGIGLKGDLQLVLRDDEGRTMEERNMHNLIVDNGFETIAYKIAPHNGSSSSTPFNYIAIGSGEMIASSQQTSLENEITRKQDPQAEYLNLSSKKLILQVVYGEGEGTGTISECGLFDSEFGGNMMARQTFQPITKGANDTLTITWTITLATI